MSEDGYIKFIANFKDWQAVKNCKIDDKTKPEDIVFYLMSITQSFDNRLESFVKKTLDEKTINDLIEEAGKASKGNAENIAKALEFINSRKVNATINELIEKKGLVKQERDGLNVCVKVVVARKILGNNGLMVDFSQIKIPGSRKPKGTKGKD